MRAAITAAILIVTGALATSPAFAQGKWTSLKPIPQGEEEVYGTAADGKLYVLGGLGIFPGWEPKQMLWSFDPGSNEWTRLPNIPGRRRNFP
jgi:N-acetylneuraminic acid mutarotase